VRYPNPWNEWDVNNWIIDENGVSDPKMFIEVEKASLHLIREGLNNTPFTPK